jgi:probable F420-dependent oxidoreductase
MKFGLSFFPTDFTIRFDDLARAAEAHGFESLLVAEHTHIPTSRITVPSTGMRDLPPQYSHTLDPFVALATAAAVTKTLKLGTGVCLVIERDPIITAKEVASLDLLSDGRFIFGVGAGWNVEEMANHGTEFKSRRRLMRERIEAMKAIWTQDEP